MLSYVEAFNLKESICTTRDTCDNCPLLGLDLECLFESDPYKSESILEDYIASQYKLTNKVKFEEVFGKDAPLTKCIDDIHIIIGLKYEWWNSLYQDPSNDKEV